MTATSVMMGNEPDNYYFPPMDSGTIHFFWEDEVEGDKWSRRAIYEAKMELSGHTQLQHPPHRSATLKATYSQRTCHSYLPWEHSASLTYGSQPPPKVTTDIQNYFLTNSESNCIKLPNWRMLSLTKCNVSSHQRINTWILIGNAYGNTI